MPKSLLFSQKVGKPNAQTGSRPPPSSATHCTVSEILAFAQICAQLVGLFATRDGRLSSAGLGAAILVGGLQIGFARLAWNCADAFANGAERFAGVSRRRFSRRGGGPARPKARGGREPGGGWPGRPGPSIGDGFDDVRRDVGERREEPNVPFGELFFLCDHCKFDGWVSQHRLDSASGLHDGGQDKCRGARHDNAEWKCDEVSVDFSRTRIVPSSRLCCSTYAPHAKHAGMPGGCRPSSEFLFSLDRTSKCSPRSARFAGSLSGWRPGWALNVSFDVET